MANTTDDRTTVGHLTYFGSKLTHSPNNRLNASIVISCILCLLFVAGCEEKYKPAAYKAAPRVEAGDAESDNDAQAKSSRPDVTDWTSPDAIRGNRKLPVGARGYRGDAYRGYGSGAYSGIGRNYRGYGKSSAYRGYGKKNYRGYDSGPSKGFQGFRR